MAKQTVNIGTAPTGAGGDTFRSAAQKMQDNTDEVYETMGDGNHLFKPVQQGGGKDQSNNKIYVGWSGSALKAQVDSTDLGNIFTDYSNRCLAVGQSYQVATAFRVKNTIYKNTSGKPRFVAIYLTQNSGNGDVSIAVNYQSISFGNYAIGQNYTLYALVPDGSSYSLSVPSGVEINIWSWMELG